LWWKAIIFVCAAETQADRCEVGADRVIRPPTKFAALSQCETAMTIKQSHVMPLPFGRYAYVVCVPDEQLIGDLP